ncbi:hypothetical protein Gogos_020308 [Gossypium gossypioides]|uniref:Uncharacterized protein n=1 Tax=Gossypium gossypioides TaxID=34282 RepID=A0A7J9D5E3_GOSGO|nr:hypothetical protein [Gossypium gossypioides]
MDTQQQSSGYLELAYLGFQLRDKQTVQEFLLRALVNMDKQK